ncbi:VaFE repeat-containing surface-anchored protein [Acidipropionibacterium jensenii]|uniref:VaFE repeat-containing surface-anchored protein n=1 Tax=Acidipropionibacterium jensenii TaxID=1749 RepID=UPI00214C7514
MSASTRRRLTLTPVAGLAVMASGLSLIGGLAAAPAAHAANYTSHGITHKTGVKINVGEGWIGSYQLNNTAGGSAQFYCADPEHDGPSAGGIYTSKDGTTRWVREGGTTLSANTVAQLAYITGKWGATHTNKQAAAVEAAVYAVQGISQYSLANGSYGKQRTDAAGVTTLARAMVTEAQERARAGSWKLSVSLPTRVTRGSSYTATIFLTNGAGALVPGTSVTVKDSTGVTRTLSTGSTGKITTSFTASSTTPKITATATLPDTKVWWLSPSNSKAQRLLIAGSTVGVRGSASTTAVTPTTPTIGTTAYDKADSDKFLVGTTGGTIVDKVSYAGLTAGKKYSLTGTLMDKATNKPVQVGGKDLTVTKTFTPTTDSGNTPIEFAVPAGTLSGRTVVAFEHLSLDGTEVAAHADISDEGQTVYVPSISTTATDKADGDKFLVGTTGGTIVDKVSYTGLKTGTEYRVSGTLMDKATGKAVQVDGDDVEASTTFTPTTADGTVSLEFDVPASALAGKTVVAFETMSNGGKNVAVHTDINDSGQSVYIPKIATTATDAVDGDKFVLASGGTITDTVAYSGLQVGKEYQVSGTLMDKATGKAVLVDGKQVTATRTFTADKVTGTVKMTFTVPRDALAGRTVVAFEHVSQNGKDVAVHTDIHDTAQTVYIPSIKTLATDAADGDKFLSSKGGTITDTVSYKGLQPGVAYQISGTVMDATTGKAVQVDGKDLTATKTFTPNTADGTTTVSFTVPKDVASGRTLVLFEKLSSGGKEVAVHTDINDSGQSVYGPRLATTATDRVDGDKFVLASGGTITDTVAYSGLQVGKEYQVSGTLMDKATGKAVLVDGKQVTATRTFTPEKASGTVEMTFTVPKDALAGKTVVAFETMSQNGKEVGVHTDIHDTAQTVYIPGVGTSLVDRADDDKVINPTAASTVVDTVSYTGLQPGEKYTVSGVLVDPATGKKTSLTASVTFTATKDDGTVKVAFQVPAGQKATKLVAFETLTHNGKTVALHQDLKDAAQTVSLVTPATPPVTPRPTPSVTPQAHINAGDPAGHDGFGPLAAVGASLAAVALGFVGVETYRRRNHKAE